MAKFDLQKVMSGGKVQTVSKVPVTISAVGREDNFIFGVCYFMDEDRPYIWNKDGSIHKSCVDGFTSLGEKNMQLEMVPVKRFGYAAKFHDGTFGPIFTDKVNVTFELIEVSWEE